MRVSKVRRRVSQPNFSRDVLYKSRIAVNETNSRREMLTRQSASQGSQREDRRAEEARRGRGVCLEPRSVSLRLAMAKDETGALWKLEATEIRINGLLILDWWGTGTCRASPRLHQRNKEGNTVLKTGSSTPFSGKENAIPSGYRTDQRGVTRHQLGNEWTAATENPRLRTSAPQHKPCSKEVGA